MFTLTIPYKYELLRTLAGMKITFHALSSLRPAYTGPSRSESIKFIIIVSYNLYSRKFKLFIYKYFYICVLIPSFSSLFQTYFISTISYSCSSKSTINIFLVNNSPLPIISLIASHTSIEAAKAGVKDGLPNLLSIPLLALSA